MTKTRFNYLEHYGKCPLHKYRYASIFTQAKTKVSYRARRRPHSAKMAAPLTDAGEFEIWLNDRLDNLEVDREVYGAYILGILQEEENDDEKEDALRGILSAFLVIIRASMSVSAAVSTHTALMSAVICWAETIEMCLHSSCYDKCYNLIFCLHRKDADVVIRISDQQV